MNEGHAHGDNLSDHDYILVDLHKTVGVGRRRSLKPSRTHAWSLHLSARRYLIPNHIPTTEWGYSNANPLSSM